jgi:ferredoxin
MVMPQRRLKNDPDRRMDMLVTNTNVLFPLKDFEHLNRKNLDYWITELRKGETSVRHLRKRLEALRDGSERTCPACGRPVTGRPDAIYCTTNCRVRAHRQAKKEQEQR